MSSDPLATTAQTIITWLAPFFPYLIKGIKLAGRKWFEALGEKGGKEAIEKAEKLWEMIQKKSGSNKTVGAAATILAENPGSTEAKKILTDALVDVSRTDPSIITEAQNIIGTQQSINIHEQSGGVGFYGSGNVTISGDVVGGDQTKTEK